MENYKEIDGRLYEWVVVKEAGKVVVSGYFPVEQTEEEKQDVEAGWLYILNLPRHEENEHEGGNLHAGKHRRSG